MKDMNMDTNEKMEIIREELVRISRKEITLMEVCGTHTMSIAKHSIRSMLPKNINVISGPGCPVCVTGSGEMKVALDFAKRDDCIVVTFGDMLKVPLEGDTLLNYKNVKVVYNPLDSLKYARENPDKAVIFIGVGFETTTPLISALIMGAKNKGIENLFVLPMNKTVPIAMEAILGAEDNEIDGLILPGHVSAITGRKYFDFVKKFDVNGVVSGFEALDVMKSIYLLVKNINEDKVEVVNNYTRAVTEEGNRAAYDMIYEVFEASDADWRGIGVIPQSGLLIKSRYDRYNALSQFNVEFERIEEAKGCLCGPILMGKNRPTDCKFFGTSCNPLNPIGPCMVSSEGTCAAYYKYNL